MFPTKKHTTIASKQGEKMKKICLISAWFGKFPNNMQYFLESVRHNRTIDFLCYSDALESTLEYALPDNFHIINITFEQFNNKIESELHIKCKLKKVYKICDFRPFFGVIFEKELREYDFWGFHDFDMVFGNIRKFFTDEVLECNDRVFINGHLTLFRNANEINRICLEGSSKQNLEDVIKSVETIAYDEMSGMRLAFQERSLKQYINPDIWVDIVESMEHVVNNNRYNKPKQFYMWDDGKLWWCVKEKGGIVRLRELVYVHFQKRKMHCDTFEENRPFYIYNKDITYVVPESNLTTVLDITNFYIKKIARRVHRKLSK